MIDQPVTQVPKTRTAVKRPGAETYLLISLVSFGVTVVATRVFLELTGYPQVGNAVLHIAHALWGGLLLFVSGLVTLVLVNRWAFTISAVLNGVGVGLFIDEVGKFITRQNDYFFAPAAPMIYSLFLLMTLLFFLVRRSRQVSPRTSMYRALVGLREVLDNDLDPVEQERMLAELANAQTASEEHIRLLAGQLTSYLHDRSIPITSYHPGFDEQLKRWAKELGGRLGRKNHYRLIVVAAAILGASAMLVVISLVGAWLSPPDASRILSSLLLTSTELTIQRPVWLVVRLVLQLVVGLLYLLALWRFFQRRELAGVDAALFASLLSLTVVHLLTFYLNQFGSLMGLFFNLALFFVLLAYRSWYLGSSEAGVDS